MGFAKILSPDDFFPEARAALHVVAGIARGSSASLVLAHVRNPRRWTVSSDFGRVPAVVQNVVDREPPAPGKWLLLGKELGARVIAGRFLAGTPYASIALASND
jgi:hypothetical protein